jgi:hypothetical protein
VGAVPGQLTERNNVQNTSQQAFERRLRVVNCGNNNPKFLLIIRRPAQHFTCVYPLVEQVATTKTQMGSRAASMFKIRALRDLAKA